MSAAAEYWPEQFGNLDQATHDQLRQNMRLVRPVLVNGVEALVMVHCYCESLLLVTLALLKCREGVQQHRHRLGTLH